MLTVNHLSVTVQHQPILKDVTFSVDAGVLSIIGPSGAGKSTLLHCIAGIQSYTGTTELAGQNLASIPLPQRHIGLVTQQSSLLPHLTVFDNIALPLRFRKLSQSDITKKVSELLERFSISTLAQRLPQQISGGEQQRVAIARAFIYQPQLLLLDEPFGSLDALWRYDLLHWLKTILAQQPVPTLFVTHDQREARFMSTHVLCLINGTVGYWGDWADIVQSPNQTVQTLLAKML